jgi:hypothetical protein
MFEDKKDCWDNDRSRYLSTDRFTDKCVCICVQTREYYRRVLNTVQPSLLPAGVASADAAALCADESLYPRSPFDDAAAEAAGRVEAEERGRQERRAAMVRAPTVCALVSPCASSPLTSLISFGSARSQAAARAPPRMRDFLSLFDKVLRFRALQDSSGLVVLQRQPPTHPTPAPVPTVRRSATPSATAAAAQRAAAAAGARPGSAAAAVALAVAAESEGRSLPVQEGDCKWFEVRFWLYDDTVEVSRALACHCCWPIGLLSWLSGCLAARLPACQHKRGRASEWLPSAFCF